MTVQIALMNQEAVTLATDSTGIVETIDGLKIHHSATKIYELTHNSPIGIMVDSSSGLMTVPWGTIVKMYKDKLGAQKFDRLKDYAENFIEFLKNEPLVPEAEQERYMNQRIVSFLKNVVKSVEKDIENHKSTSIFNTLKENLGTDIDAEKIDWVECVQETLEDKQIKDIISDTIKKYEDRLGGFSSTVPPNFIRDTANKYKSQIDTQIKDAFRDFPTLSKSQYNRLRNTCANHLSNPRDIDTTSQILIAGFGEEEMFPSTETFSIDIFVNNQLIYRKYESFCTKVDFDNPASIASFPESGGIIALIQGIDPMYQSYTVDNLQSLFREYQDIVLSRNDSSEEQRQEIVCELKYMEKYILEKYETDIYSFAYQLYEEPFLEIIKSLPKEALPSIVESMVKLSLLKRNSSEEIEMIDGPVDIVMISKVDGFEWIKRKGIVQ